MVHYPINNNFWRRTNPCTLALVITLCSLTYLLGVWERGSCTNTALSKFAKTITVLPSKASSSNLDFSSHHSYDDNITTALVDEETIKTYPLCDVKYSEYTPCEDIKRSWKFPRERLIIKERHCPEKNELLKCRVPAPFGYKKPFKWPLSRDHAWFNNVPHKELTVEKAIQNWIRVEGDKFRFPGGGTMFSKGADHYIDNLGKFINLKDGSIRTAIDTGCGVASWGAYLLSRNIMTMSFAPRDSHEAQVQFALERGVPAMIGVMASKRLPYPSRSFDMAHCSRCLIPWSEYDGQNLMELDRVLRPGGYWILSGPPIAWKSHYVGWNRTKEDLNDEQTRIENITKSLCWRKVIEKGDVAIWQKPLNHFQCKKFPSTAKTCSAQDPDMSWYKDVETCMTPMPDVENDEEVAGGKLENWPKRLTAIPPRISMGTVNGITPEVYEKDSKLWEKRVAYYKDINGRLRHGGMYRNVLDMNARLGGFAAAFNDIPLWVMNVVPVEAKVNTLGVIYERGLIGTYMNWCEAMSTYPRTYDFIHADSIFTIYKDKCEMEDILLEMDRILRPEGALIIRDNVEVLEKVKQISDGLNWDSRMYDHEDGPLETEKVLFAVKLYATAPAPAKESR